MADIPVGFEQAYSNYVQHLAQSKGGKLWRTAGQVKNEKGVATLFDTVGSIDVDAITTRHGDTDYGDDNYGRRRATNLFYSKGVLVDEEDDVRVLFDPANVQTQRLLKAIGRREDRTIIAALGGNADVITSTDGMAITATATALPTAQKVVVASSGLTAAKIRATKKLLDDVDADEDGRYFVIGSYQLNTDLLSDSTLTSADYNSVKALVRGELNTWMGFTWIRTNLLTVTSSVRYCYAYHSSALGVNTIIQPRIRANELPTKNYATGVHLKLGHGAVRVEDALVVEVACQEA